MLLPHCVVLVLKPFANISEGADGMMLIGAISVDRCVDIRVIGGLFNGITSSGRV